LDIIFEKKFNESVYSTEVLLKLLNDVQNLIENEKPEEIMPISDELSLRKLNPVTSITFKFNVVKHRTK